MSRRARRLWVAFGTLAVLTACAVTASVLVLQSSWLREKVRARIVAEVEKATGGRSEARAFSFDWHTLRARVDGFVLHGTEGPGKPPLFQAQSITVGLKIVSLLKRQVDIESLEVARPGVYLVLGPDGRTNVPEPKVKHAGKPVMETVLDLAVRRFALENGAFEVEGRGKSPFSARGENFRALFAYRRPRYQGDIAVRPLEFVWGGRKPLPVDIEAALAFERDRVEVSTAGLATAKTRVELRGAGVDLASGRGDFTYTARLNVPDLEPILGIRKPPVGTVLSSGTGTFEGIRDFHLRGDMHASGISYGDTGLRLSGFHAEGRVEADPQVLALRALRFSGTTIPGRKIKPVHVDGVIERASLRHQDIDITGARLAALGGTFAGAATIRAFDRLRAEGQVNGFETRRLLSLASSQTVPWNGRLSGPLHLEVLLKQPDSLIVAAPFQVTPADGPPVTGSVDFHYEDRTETVDLGRSYLNLPSTRADFSGVLGRQLSVRVETRDLDDLLPAFGAATLPVKLDRGSLTFHGTVNGKLDDPTISGDAAGTGIRWQDKRFDSVRAAVIVSKGGLNVQNAEAALGSFRARFAGEAGLRDWKLLDSSPLSASGAVRDADLADLVALAGRREVPVSGKLTASARLSGTAKDPRVAAEVEIAAGSLYGEPFDRASATVSYSGETAETAGAHIAAGSRRLDVKAAYRHAPADFSNGRLHFEVTTNNMPVEQFRTLAEARPGLTGALQLTAAGDLAVTFGGVRVIEVSGNAGATAIALNGVALGNAQVVAATKAGVLTAYLNSDFAGSAVRGEGEWRMEGTYPGSLKITFSRLDFIRLHNVLLPSKPAVRMAGSIEGSASASGPLVRPDLWKAALRVTDFQLGPASPTRPSGSQDFRLHNAGPIEVTLAGGLVRVEQAHFTGRLTDLTVTGTAAFPKSVLDLRVKGRVDLATLQDLDRDITASGTLTTDATVRGSFTDPAVNGRLEMQNAAFNLEGFPNGIYNAKGVLMFSGTRATIQTLTGESGGGTVRLTGFAGYESDQVVFRLHLRADKVRVRYPPGVSTVGDASLNWTGSSDRSMVSGTVTVLRTGFNPRSDLSSILAGSSEPVRTPSAQSGIVSGMNFDVQVETAPDITVESSLAQDIQVEANLRLRGTVTNPALLGRVNITQGQIVFFGTKYTLNQGSISFFNPARIEPIFDIDLETKARGIDITLTVSGPINKLNLTPRSDPPLQFNEIVALLATGRTPTASQPNMIMPEQTTTAAPQSWQQMGASALLGQAIANPIAGRLQRFFGVTRLKIDPTLTGVEANPQARLTLEQQITPNITFTYITNVTSSNPLVVQVEWALSRKWSVIAVRDENGLFGLDFLYKKRF